MIYLENVNKKLVSGNGVSFQIKDITFTLPKGYIMGVVGANGSGKTTLLNILLGLYKQDSGMVKICGKTYEEEDNEKDFKRTVADKIGYVLQGDWFSSYLTLLENGKMYGKYYSKYDEKVFREYLKNFELDEKKKLNSLSKGEKLKFEMAFALAHKPELLILDEPTANFDLDFRREFLHLITEFVSDGEHSVVLATHIMEDLDRIADYILYMNKGNMLFSMNKEDLMDNFRIIQGEDYKINLMEKERIIYKEKGEYGSKALVKHNNYYHYDKELTVTIPSMEDIFYSIEKYLIKNKEADFLWLR